MDKCHYRFVQTHRMYNTKSEPQYKLWTLVIVMCQCRFISGYKCTTVVGNADNTEGYACEGQGIYGEFLYFLLILMQT